MTMRPWWFYLGAFIGGIIYTTILGLLLCELRSLMLKKKTQMAAGAVADTSDLYYDDLVIGSQNLKAYAAEAKQVRAAQREARIKAREQAFEAQRLLEERDRRSVDKAPEIPKVKEHSHEIPVTQIPPLALAKTLSGRDRSFVQDPDYRKEQAQDYDNMTTSRLLEKLSSRRKAYEDTTNSPEEIALPDAFNESPLPGY